MNLFKETEISTIFYVTIAAKMHARVTRSFNVIITEMPISCKTFSNLTDFLRCTTELYLLYVGLHVLFEYILILQLRKYFINNDGQD